jgi:hypothetical protein
MLGSQDNGRGTQHLGMERHNDGWKRTGRLAICILARTWQEYFPLVEAARRDALTMFLFLVPCLMSHQSRV